MANTNAFSLLSDDIKAKLTTLNISTPTPVQNQVIPVIAEGKNLLFESETGTGKTYAYLLPLINKLEQDEDKTKLRIIVLAPTFELASQINSAAKAITARKTALLIGGAPIKRQIEVLKEKPQIIIGTAARLTELIRLKKLKALDLFAAVFDECDRLVKKESVEDTQNFQICLPKTSQIIACSATINKKCRIYYVLPVQHRAIMPLSPAAFRKMDFVLCSDFLVHRAVFLSLVLYALWRRQEENSGL